MSSAEPVSWNPFDPAFRVDPWPTYRRLLDEEPVHRSPLGLLVLSRYADCMALLRHPNASSDDQNSAMFEEFLRAQEDPEWLLTLRERRPFLFMDPPDHTRLRGLVSKAFTPRVVERLRPRIAELVDGLLDAVADAGELELIGDVAYPLPVTVISEMLGVPAEDHERFAGWSRELARSLDPEITLPPEVIERREGALAAFYEYFQGLIGERRARPTDDLLSALISAEDEGHQLSENELLSTLTLLLIAGHETTVNLIGNGVLALARNREQQERLRRDPSLAKSAVEELLRYDAPVTMTGRFATADIELPDVTIGKGQAAVLLLAAANRDAAQFVDPDRLDLGRADNHHVAFGLGIHFCLGAPLARVEGQIAISALVQRFEEIELVSDALEYKENIVLRGLARLPLKFKPGAHRG